MTPARKFANGTILLAIVALTLLLFYFGYGQGRAISPRLYGALMLLLLLFLAALRLPLAIKLNLSLLLISATLTLYALEAFLLFNGNPLDYRTPNFIAARSQGLPFDKRTALQVVSDLRRDGVDAYPYIAPNPYVEVMPQTSAGNIIYALGGLASVTTVHCNEGGAYTIYQSDRYGFHNPDAIWDESRLDLVAVGDSFTQGACVPSDQNYVSLIRNAYPQTLNLGASGNGPLSALATLKEYAAVRKPQTVLWFYYEGNDTGDFMAELTHPVLVQYVEDDFRQELAARQRDVAEVQRRQIQRIMADAADAQRRKQLDALRLYNVRRLLRLTRAPAPLDDAAKGNDIAKLPPRTAQRAPNQQRDPLQKANEQAADSTYFRDDPATSFDTLSADSLRLSTAHTTGHDPALYDPVMELGLDRFDLVLRHAQQSVAAWGGELVLVYLPDYMRFSPIAPIADAAYYRPQVLSIIKEAGIPLLDLYPVFAEHPDVLSLYPFGLYGHYSEAGNALVAEKVLAFLEN